MASTAGWYIARLEIASTESAKAGGSTSVTDTVFQWKNATTAPTVQTADITGVTAIVGGPYPTEAAAKAAAAGDKSTTTPVAGTGAKPGVSTSTPGSSNGTLTIPNPLGSVVDFLQGLTSANLWIRVAKVVVGGVILIVGIARLTHLDEKATGIAKQAIKVAPFL